ncbi:hypothetical protein LMG26411_02611 [Cupriavidus numazuensis]|uniref:Uncharacterized protein n=1 Tax=Cupriavidus numazuensis TaxID=221992 RepID=A0ABN7PX09_9BURK|nr:hypothetical protein LMG26411_02611 [Cupriavidus numazuensis]
MNIDMPSSQGIRLPTIIHRRSSDSRSRPEPRVNCHLSADDVRHRVAIDTAHDTVSEASR